jgi:hypothetical protein
MERFRNTLPPLPAGGGALTRLRNLVPEFLHREQCGFQRIATVCDGFFGRFSVRDAPRNIGELDQISAAILVCERADGKWIIFQSQFLSFHFASSLASMSARKRRMYHHKDERHPPVAV